MATVPSTPRTSTQTLAADSAGPFNVGFRIFDTSYLKIYVDDVLQASWTTQATFTDGYDDAATVTPPSTVVSGSVIRIESWMITGRASDYVNGDPSLTNNMNVELARLWSLVGDHDREINRSMRATTDVDEAPLVSSGMLATDATGVPYWALLADIFTQRSVYIDSGIYYWASFAAFIADTTTYVAGATHRILSIGATYTATASTGNLGQTNAGGQQYDVVLPDCGMFLPEHFGGTTDVYINRAQSAGATLGGVPTLFTGSGQYIVSAPLIIKDHCGYVGANRDFEIYLANGANCDVFQTDGFATQTGTNIWFKTEGVLTDFVMLNLRINGNASAQTAASYGIRSYGKRFTWRDLEVYNCYSDNIYSECAYKGGQTDIYDDSPECVIENVWTSASANGNGITFRGPHDGRLNNIWPQRCANGAGIKFETDNTTFLYKGSADVGFVHSYSNNQGIVANAYISGQYFLCENNYHEGITGTTTGIEINELHGYSNSRYVGAGMEALTTDVSFDLSAGGWKVNIIFLTLEFGGTGVKTGANTRIGYASVDGKNLSGIGVDIDGNQNFIDARPFNFDGGTGTGIRMGNSGNVQGCFLRITTRACNTHFNNVSAGNQANWLTADIYTNAGETGYTGIWSTTSERWDLQVRGASTLYTRNKGTGTVSAAATTAVITHNLAQTPAAKDIRITWIDDIGAGVSWRISASTSTTFTLTVSSAPAGAVTFGWEADVGWG